MRITADMTVLPTHSSVFREDAAKAHPVGERQERSRRTREELVGDVDYPRDPGNSAIGSSARARTSPGRAIAIIRHFPISAGLPPRSPTTKPCCFEKEDRSTIETISNRSILEVLG